MAKRLKRRCEELPILHPDAAGIDVGASELFVAACTGFPCIRSWSPAGWRCVSSMRNR
jgi:hypothetical protein